MGQPQGTARVTAPRSVTGHGWPPAVHDQLSEVTYTGRSKSLTREDKLKWRKAPADVGKSRCLTRCGPLIFKSSLSCVVARNRRTAW
jgi:hypothetical protein